MDKYGMLRTENDFRLDFNAILDRAKHSGIDIHDEVNRKFLEDTAEHIAELNAKIRQLYGFLHPS
jgi:hypothetical protein